MTQNVILIDDHRALAVPHRNGTNFLDAHLSVNRHLIPHTVYRPESLTVSPNGVESFVLFECLRPDSELKKRTIYVPKRHPMSQYKSGLSLILDNYMTWDRTVKNRLNMADIATAEQIFALGFIDYCINNTRQTAEPQLLSLEDHLKPAGYYILLWCAAGLDVKTLDLETGEYQDFVYSISYHPEQNGDAAPTNTMFSRRGSPNPRTTIFYETLEEYFKNYHHIILGTWLDFYNKIYNELVIGINHRSVQENQQIAREFIQKRMVEDVEEFKIRHKSAYIDISNFVSAGVFPEYQDIFTAPFTDWVKRSNTQICGRKNLWRNIHG